MSHGQAEVVLEGNGNGLLLRTTMDDNEGTTGDDSLSDVWF